MKKTLYLLIALVIIGAGAFLRLYHFTYSAPFDWDQNRDYKEITQIAQGKITLIGPVAKGEGGFFLGPLYYYLATPAYLILGGNPIALPLTSIIVDVLAIVAMLILFPRRIGRVPTLVVASVWAMSWFLVEAAKISWNVALMPLWSVMFVYIVSAHDKMTLRDLTACGLMAGLSWHVHASLIPLALIISMWRWRDLRSVWHVAAYMGGYILAISPLVLFDLRHSGMERYLLMQYIEGSGKIVADWPAVLTSVMGRLGKNIYALLLGSNDLHVMWGIAAVAGSVIFLRSKEKLYRVAASLLLINVGLTILLREPGFPEYYLLPAMVPFLLMGSAVVTSVRTGRLAISVLVCIIIVAANTQVYSFKPAPFSLYQKSEVARAVSSGEPIEFKTDLPFGRDAGMMALIKSYGGNVSSSPTVSYVMTDKNDASIFSDGEIYQDVGWYGGFRLVKRELQ